LAVAVTTIQRYICDPGVPDPVAEWFRALPDAPEETEGKGVRWLHFRSLGPLARVSDDSFDLERSPLVGLVMPTVRREILWTIGKVVFVPRPLRKQYPRLHAISVSLRKWLATFDCVLSNQPGFRNEWDYYFEGTARSGAPVYALSGGLDALRRGQYFVNRDSDDFVVDKFCAQLRLRGIQCEPIRESGSPPK
jgi:hypothetical protein